jgi:hypothetical protein
MTPEQTGLMFPGVPREIFRVHDWRNDVITLGRVPGEFVAEITANALTYDWPAQLNKVVCQGGHDLILSVDRWFSRRNWYGQLQQNLFAHRGWKDQ